MNTTALKHTIFLAGMMVASMTFAGQDVIKCVDSGGNVTLTDTACGNGVEVAREPVAVETDYAAEVALPEASVEIVDALAMVPARVVSRTYFPSANELRFAAKQRAQIARPSMGVDVAMLKVAKTNSQLAGKPSRPTRMTFASN
ncbi:DUF4124 domain-containing protein [Massilia glaciei]|uniref:DUF4124 domain-containing protein n=1 Tax=Massilia glaciei TaxID=1524097 RepID=A0A2U2HLN6_9BURK|nr:DUF4124 domain-containing protein [Massilia glaciei]PWF48434.1 DUF4124 domain-containing protein [Massilia glaciei]